MRVIRTNRSFLAFRDRQTHKSRDRSEFVWPREFVYPRRAMTRDSISDESRHARNVFWSWRVGARIYPLSHSLRRNSGARRGRGGGVEERRIPSPRLVRPWRIIHRPESLSHGFVRLCNVIPWTQVVVDFPFHTSSLTSLAHYATTLDSAQCFVISWKLFPKFDTVTNNTYRTIFFPDLHKRHKHRSQMSLLTALIPK